MLNLSWRIWAPRTAASFSTVADLRWIKPRSNDICILNQFKKICMCIHIYIYTNIICIITHISFSFFLHACLQSDTWFVENISMIIIKHAFNTRPSVVHVSEVSGAVNQIGIPYLQGSHGSFFSLLASACKLQHQHIPSSSRRGTCCYSVSWTSSPLPSSWSSS